MNRIVTPEISQIVALNVAKLGLKFEARDVAPDTFANLKSSQTGGRLVVWSGESSNTIYGDASSNWAFRAWHDFLHLKLNAPFTLEGEIHVAKAQASQCGTLAASIIMAEVQGQVEYFNKYGKFPVNQIEFIENYLKGIL